MKINKQRKLQKAGWRVGSVEEFLGLSPEESAYIEMKLALCRSMKQARVKKRLSQIALARKIESSQSRVAKMEAGDPSVSVDALVMSLFALGVSRRKLAQVVATGSLARS